MKIILWGATGRVGNSLIEKSIKEGHQIIAFVRNKNKLQMGSPNLSIVEGDIYNKESLVKLSDQKFDAIINVIGADPLKPSSVFTDATRSIIDLFSNKESKRYIAITGTAQMKKNFFGKLAISILKKTPVKHGIKDHQNAYDLIIKSTFDWTLVGCPYIKDGKEIGKFKTSLVFRGGFKIIHPGDVAQAIINELDKKNYHEIIGIWY
jgi:putative NADH-flavin reductase